MPDFSAPSQRSGRQEKTCQTNIRRKITGSLLEFFLYHYLSYHDFTALGTTTGSAPGTTCIEIGVRPVYSPSVHTG